MKVKFTFSKDEYSEETTIIKHVYLTSLAEEMEQLTNYGFKIFKIEILPEEKPKIKSSDSKQ